MKTTTTPIVSKRMNESKIILAAPERCVPVPWHNREDLQLTPEFVADIKRRGVMQNVIARPMPKERFAILEGQRGARGFILVDRSNDEWHGPQTYASQEAAALARPEYEIIAGVRRWSAARQAKLKTIPINIVDLDDQAAQETRLVENLQRENLSALDEARQMVNALNTGNYGEGTKGVDALASALGKSRAHVYSRLRLLGLSEPVLEAMRAGKIPATVAELIATLPGQELQQKALKRALAGNYVDDPDDDYGAPSSAPAKKRKKEKLKARQARLKAEAEAEDARRREPMSYRDVKAMLNQDFRLDLATDARWKLDDAKLLPEAGPCTTCPKRTGTVPGAFPEIKNPNLCTDPDCFAAKRAACDAVQLEKHIKAGHKVMTPEEHQKAFAKGWGLGGGWIDGDEAIHELGYGKTPRQLLGKAMPAPTYAVNRDGKVGGYYRKSEILDIAGKKGLLKSEKPKAETPEQKAKREANEAAAALKERIETLRRHLAVEALLKPIEQERHGLAALRFVLDRMTDSMNQDVICARRGWRTLTDNVPRLTEAELLALIVEGCCLATYDDDYDDGLTSELAKWLGMKLDHKALVKQARAVCARTDAKAKEAKAKATPAKGKTSKKKK